MHSSQDKASIGQDKTLKASRYGIRRYVEEKTTSFDSSSSKYEFRVWIISPPVFPAIYPMNGPVYFPMKSCTWNHIALMKLSHITVKKLIEHKSVKWQKLLTSSTNFSYIKMTQNRNDDRFGYYVRCAPISVNKQRFCFCNWK